jgi:hypothetical protein
MIKRGNGIGSATDAAKVNLFKLMKRIIVKNVKNYASLSRNSAVTEQCFEEDEMYAEAFIVMMKCVENFQVSKRNCFYFYFNKSLSRNFYRMFYKEVRKLEVQKDYELFAMDTFVTNDFDYESLSLTINNLGLDEFDKRVLESKLKYEKKDEFIVNNEDATVSKYYSSIRKIKEKLKKLIDNGEL